MSEVRTCEFCCTQRYASEAGAPAQHTVEWEADDGAILSREWILCGDCYAKLVVGPPTTCPYCLEPLWPETSTHDVLDCSEGSK